MMRLSFVISPVSGPGVAHGPFVLPFILHRLQGKVYRQPVLHALTLTRSCHADSAPYRRCPWVTVQHFAQP
jgi:hypothetical protein